MREIKEDTKNGKLSDVHRLEESILLKYPYYTKWSIDSMPFLSNYQWCFSQNYKNYKICMGSPKPQNS